MNDRDFRQQDLVLPIGFAISARGTVVGNDRYKPDLLISHEGTAVAVVESSSTGDRKVALGELLQAQKFFEGQCSPGILIFSLCGRGATAPRPETQVSYLRPYFLYLCRSAAAGLTSVHIVPQFSFSSSITALLIGGRPEGVKSLELNNAMQLDTRPLRR